MKNKQVMNRQTSSKELHLISCGWENVHRSSPMVQVYGGITPFTLC